MKIIDNERIWEHEILNKFDIKVKPHQLKYKVIVKTIKNIIK